MVIKHHSYLTQTHAHTFLDEQWAATALGGGVTWIGFLTAAFYSQDWIKTPHVFSKLLWFTV